jgi:GTP-binding protein HflX
LRTVNDTLKELGALEKPTILVFNKIDLYRERYFDDLVDEATKVEIVTELKSRLKNEFDHVNVFISAQTKENIDVFRDMLEIKVKEFYAVRYPHQVKHW